MTLWLNIHDDALKAHVGAGKLSFAGMAAAINGEFRTGFSRNAAIGRAHRLGLVGRGDPAIRKPRTRRPKTPIESVARITRGPQQSPETIRLRCVEIEPRHLSFAELQDGDCHYPYGRDNAADDAPVTYCGHPAVAGPPYCRPHQALCAGQRPATTPRASFTIGRVA